MTEQTTTLKRTLGSFFFVLWGDRRQTGDIREYFGWSYGWSQAGTMGFMVVALAVAAMYCAFIFSFTELTTAIRTLAALSPMPTAPSGPPAALSLVLPP